MNDKTKGFLKGYAIGTLFTVWTWALVASEVEKSKVRNGYLTYENKTYTVELFDTLDVPDEVRK